jgi:hypothetical protein
MVVMLILLLLSVSLNFALIFGKVRRFADEDIMIIRARESLPFE